MARVRAPGIYNANGIWQIGPMIIAVGHRRSSSSAGCPGSSRPTSTGARASASRRPAPTSPTCARPRSATATSTSSTARRSGSRPRTSPKWGLFLLRTDPDAIERGAKHEGITAFIVDMETPGIECRPDPRHRRRRDVQRGVVHRRAHPGRLPARRRGAGLAGRDGHARPRARRHRRASRSRWRPTCGR